MKATRRFANHFATTAEPKGLAANHAAVLRKRTLFPTTVAQPGETLRVLIDGKNQRKIGDMVVKGRWRGMRIFCLTLEERATCPDTCHHWLDCYGNGMPLARRHVHGADLEAFIAFELAQKQAEHPAGFVVRLHILGDFYDEAYVFLWRRWLAQFPALRIFGYTARPADSIIGQLVNTLNIDFGDRVWIRFSRKWPSIHVLNAITIARPDPTIDAIICPAQTGQTECCGTCGLCWSTDKIIAFLQHGGFKGGRPKSQSATA